MGRGAPPGPRHPRARFGAAEIRWIRKIARQGWTQRAIAAEITAGGRPCCHQVIGKVVRRERYADVR